MNRQIRRLGAVLLLCFAALFVRLNFLQVFGAEELAENPLNTRRVVEDFGQQRGDIITADGVVVAMSVEVGGQLRRERRYPEGELYGHITGYFGFNVGATGVESEYNAELAGRKNQADLTNLLDVIKPPDSRADVRLTLLDDVQRAARDALGDRKGSVVAIDPTTGDVLAMWSWPSFDPGPVSLVDLEAANDAKQALDADPNKPLLAKSYRDVFFPGSTFKVVTAAAGLATDRLGPTEPVFPVVADYVAPLTSTSMRNFGGSSCGGDLGEILRSSCNTAFAQAGAEILGPDVMIDMAERFGFNDTPPLDLPETAASIFPDDYGAELGQSDFDPPVPIVEKTPLLAQAAIGQYDVRATPLQMAMVAAGIANGGRVMAPRVVAEIRETDSRRVLHDPSPQVWRDAMDPDDAQVLSELLVGVVTDGTATSVNIPGFTVGAKTGTAQTITGAGDDDTHAWMVAFGGRPGMPPTVAVAVVVEAVPGGGQQTGGTTAGPIVREVLETALNAPPSE